MDNPNQSFADNLNQITYADDWKEAYSPVYYEKAEPVNENENSEPKRKKKKKKKSDSKPLLIMIQIVLCILLVLSFYCVKLIGGEIYSTVKNEYSSFLDDELIMRDSFESIGLDKLFDAAQN